MVLQDPVTLSREQLYREIWAEPMTKVAPRYGLSDVGLAKICRKHNIPRPPVGHWARLAHGHEVIPIPLPELDDEDVNEIQIFRKEFFGATGGQQHEAGNHPFVAVSEKLIAPCELVVKTRDALRSAAPGSDGLISADSSECLCVRVSRKSIVRALRILDAFIKAWEAQGGTVTTPTDTRMQQKIVVAMGPDSAGIELFEEVDRIAKGEHKSRHWLYRDWKYVLSGRLVLQIDELGWGHRRRWADGKKQRLEGMLGRFITGLRNLLEERRLKRLDDECVERQRAKAQAIHDERERRAAEEEQRQAGLKQYVEAWQQARATRCYLRKLQSKIANGEVEPTYPEQFARWLDWARWYADWLDPLTPTPDRPEYLVQPENTVVTDLDATRKTRAAIQTLGVVNTDELYSVTSEKLKEVVNQHHWGIWNEICRILEGLQYDVSDRKRSYWY